MTNEPEISVEKISPRLKTPRISPLPKEDRNEEQQKMIDSRNGYNLYTTLAHHIELCNRWLPMGRYLLRKSKLPARDREIIMLRMGWLCQAEYEWAQHARIAKDDVNMNDEEIHRIAEGPKADGWSAFDRTLMQMVHELRYDAMIGDDTWHALLTEYTLEQTIDALFTAAQYQLVSMVLNSIGIQLDASLKERMPDDLPPPVPAGMPMSPRLKEPRIKPLRAEQLSDEQRELIKPELYPQGVPNIYATMIVHPGLFKPRMQFGRYIMRQSSLPAQARELLIMRTSWLIKAQYEWAHHGPIAKEAGLTNEQIANIAVGPQAEVWSEDQSAILQAADELRREAFISGETWEKLARTFDTKQLVEIIYTVGGYTMTGLAINSFGIQIEEGYASRFPVT